jgi:hypothetical protein
MTEDLNPSRRQLVLRCLFAVPERRCVPAWAAEKAYPCPGYVDPAPNRHEGRVRPQAATLEDTLGGLAS